jgi:hypothetical protein
MDNRVYRNISKASLSELGFPGGPHFKKKAKREFVGTASFSR